jgi:hypothetical protein
MKIFISQNEWADSYNIYITEEGYDGKRLVASPMEFKFVPLKENEVNEPSIKISRVFGKETNFLQALSDALAKCGYKPKAVEENEGELKATKYHLEDMRKIALK